MNISRTLAACSLAAVLGAPGCAARRPVVAPVPAQVTPRVSEERDWFAAAADIRQPSQFRPFEPILEELTGEQPVPVDRVTFVSNEELRRRCDPDAGGCYHESGDSIDIGEEIYAPGLRNGTYTIGYCEAQQSSDLDDDSMIRVWIHEQGHHYDRYLGLWSTDMWINQTEAEAFTFYTAEHLARNYDARLGLSIIANRLRLYSVFGPELVAESTSELIGKVEAGDIDQQDEMLADLSVLVLLGSGFQSFGDVWYYIHTHTHEEVMQKIVDNATRAGDGIVTAQRIMLELSGSDLAAPATFDASIFEAFQPGQLRIDSVMQEVENSRAARGVYASGGSLLIFLDFRHSENMDSLHLSVSSESTPLPDEVFTVDIARDTMGRLSMRFIDETREYTYILNLPDASAVEAELTTEGNPLALTVCLSDSRQVSVDPATYVRLAESVLARVVTAMREGGSEAEASYLEGEITRIFGRASREGEGSSKDAIINMR